MSTEELKRLANTGSMDIKDLINLKSTGFKKLNLNISNLTEENAIKLIKENPKILRRPLLLGKDKLILGFQPDQYMDIV